jgi:Arc/MetJ-type ribon-helix-helix transcriptional regulator
VSLVLVKIRLSKAYLNILDDLVKSGDFRSRSDALRRLSVLGLVSYGRDRWGTE